MNGKGSKPNAYSTGLQTESFELLLLQHQSQLGVYAKSKECQPGVDPYSRLKYQLFLRLPEATNVHHYIKHATFITYGTQPSSSSYLNSHA